MASGVEHIHKPQADSMHDIDEREDVRAPDGRACTPPRLP
jgi:hypothetical protein